MTDPRPRTPPRIRPQLIGAASAGIDPRTVVDAAAIELDLDDDEADIGLEASLSLWRTAVELADDPALALHAAESVPYGAFDVLDYIPGNEPTLGAGLEAVVRHFRTTRAGIELELERGRDACALRVRRHRDVDADMRRFSTEFTLACVVLRFARTCERPWAPRLLRTSYPDPGYEDEYARIFGCPVDYGYGRDELLIDPDVLELRQPNADERLKRLLERVATEIERHLPNEGAVTYKLRRALADQMRGSVPRLESAAKQLAMSPRTLHRHLEAEGTSFQAQLDTLRSDMATRYLGDPTLALSEIAYLLGFAEVSTFSRAFRRWHGTSPAAWRRSR